MSELTHPGSESRARSKFYLTTPIYYVNARPHIGHAYTTIVADVLARRHRLLGDDTFFLTGTDEHGQKIERSAAAAGIDPQEFTDQVSGEFRSLWERMGLTHDDFIRTTEPRHKVGAQKLFRELHARGAIYLSSYTGQYSVGEEIFVEGPPGVLGPDGRPTETVTEENFFFRLSDYQLPLIDLIESDGLAIRPESRKNEVLSFLRGNVAEADGASVGVSALGNPYVVGNLRDLSVSRSSFTWGIPVPEPAASETQNKHVIYVWLDALANYMTAVGYGSDAPEDVEQFARYWPADVHIMAKEITRQHCIYWPAFLLAAGLPLPKAVTAHGWLLFDNSKMSKSKGNIVRTETILDGFGEQVYKKQFPDSTKKEQDLFAADVLRYFLLREIPFGQDGSFSFEAMVTRYNADLANGYGNLVSRTLSMISKNGGVIPQATETAAFDPNFMAADVLSYGTIRSTIIEVETGFDQLSFSAALNKLWSLVALTDGYITQYAPWKLTASGDAVDRYKANFILYSAAESIRIITALLFPLMPDAAAKVWRQLGLGDIFVSASIGKLKNLKWGGLRYGTELGPLAPIFPRAEKTLPQWMADVEAARVVKTTTKTSEEDAAMPTIDTSQDRAEPKTHPAAPLKDEGDPLDSVDGPGYKPNRPAPAEVPVDSTDAGAAPRTSAMAEPNPMAQVAGAAAGMPDLVKTPSHTEAQASGAFATSAAGSGIPDTPTIAIDDFVKVDLRVAKILVAERIPKADKLLRLEVDLGYEQRQILSGIAEWYTPEELIGRTIVIIANLALRKMRGLESKGMLLAASEGENGRPVLATFGEEIAVGTRLR